MSPRCRSYHSILEGGAGEELILAFPSIRPDLDHPTFGVGVNLVHEERIINLSSVSTGVLLHLNYPSPPPPHVDYIEHLVAPLGSVILLELYRVILSEEPFCPGGAGVIEVSDNYADMNGTWWFLCEDSVGETLAITSFLNTIHVRQRSEQFGVRLNGTIQVKKDTNYKLKLLRGSEESSVESCLPNPCKNGGKCVSSGSRQTCQCTSHFTGMFCALTLCELEPCLFGQCQLTATSYTCNCQAGYIGTTCDQKQRPCADNPCEGRGECVDKTDNTFLCRCHAWWEGHRCEHRMRHIPFKPLSERMLQEPFWLGLITVTVVLGIIGLVWCAKRHFPEKLEKLLAEEADRNRPIRKFNFISSQLASLQRRVVILLAFPIGGRQLNHLWLFF
uniref:EGF-like domain-containing protein n=1 Tax=Timema monikensis TaxID=170555 RepID=A0A7R9HRM5_9NEOP|nr:unnamed protein product [Timema monikensis]